MLRRKDQLHVNTFFQKHINKMRPEPRFRDDIPDDSGLVAENRYPFSL